MTIFRANPIRKYKPIQSEISVKELTVPNPPKLRTLERSQFRGDVDMNNE